MRYPTELKIIKMKVSVFSFLFSVGSLVGINFSAAQGFDCRTDRKIDEQIICSDQELSRLDVLYNQAYNVARRNTGPSTADLARSLNRERRECGANRNCIRSVQIRSIEAMQRLAGTASPPVPSTSTASVPITSAQVAKAGNSVGSAMQATQIVVQNSTSETAELKNQITQLAAIIREKQNSQSQNQEIQNKPVSAAAYSSDEVNIDLVAERLEQAARNRTSYITPIRPDDRDLGRTARSASEAFPKVPFYIPGTAESGRFWIEPRVGDTGQLQYDLTFVDPQAGVDQRRAVIDLTPSHLEKMKNSVAKLSEWSEIAHKNELRRAYRKRVDCFPEVSCPREGEKIDGRASTEIIFIVNDDGSTAGRIQRNKGRFDEGYNISIKSARLLASYIKYVQSRAEKEYVAGTRTAADIDAMFK